VVEGIPDLLAGTHHADTASAFSFQWHLCFRGWFEKGTLYFYDVGRLVDWVFTNCFGPVTDGEWVLDGGCGRGDKTIEIARRYPQAHVIGLDLTDTLGRSRKSAIALQNLHFIRGDLLNPPIRDAVLSKAMSWGVLHHTPDTRRAFHALARSITSSGDLTVWLYPHPADSDVFDMAYEMRDVHFRGLGHRMPKPLLLAVLPFYLALTGPYFLLRYGNPLKDPRMVRTRWISENLSLMDKARAAWFTYLDNLIPEFQDRPLRVTVDRWYAESGFGHVEWNDPGLFWASRRAKT
jgi:SAM-dependent methyltransferase